MRSSYSDSIQWIALKEELLSLCQFRPNDLKDQAFFFNKRMIHALQKITTPDTIESRKQITILLLLYRAQPETPVRSYADLTKLNALKIEWQESLSTVLDSLKTELKIEYNDTKKAQEILYSPDVFTHYHWTTLQSCLLQATALYLTYPLSPELLRIARNFRTEIEKLTMNDSFRSESDTMLMQWFITIIQTESLNNFSAILLSYTGFTLTSFFSVTSRYQSLRHEWNLKNPKDLIEELKLKPAPVGYHMPIQNWDHFKQSLLNDIFVCYQRENMLFASMSEKLLYAQLWEKIYILDLSKEIDKVHFVTLLAGVTLKNTSLSAMIDYRYSDFVWSNHVDSLILFYRITDKKINDTIHALTEIKSDWLDNYIKNIEHYKKRMRESVMLHHAVARKNSKEYLALKNIEMALNDDSLNDMPRELLRIAYLVFQCNFRDFYTTMLASIGLHALQMNIIVLNTNGENIYHFNVYFSDLKNIQSQDAECVLMNTAINHSDEITTFIIDPPVFIEKLIVAAEQYKTRKPDQFGMLRANNVIAELNLLQVKVNQSSRALNKWELETKIVRLLCAILNSSSSKLKKQLLQAVSLTEKDLQLLQLHYKISSYSIWLAIKEIESLVIVRDWTAFRNQLLMSVKKFRQSHVGKFEQKSDVQLWIEILESIGLGITHQYQYRMLTVIFKIFQSNYSLLKTMILDDFSDIHFSERELGFLVKSFGITETDCATYYFTPTALLVKKRLLTAAENTLAGSDDTHHRQLALQLKAYVLELMPDDTTRLFDYVSMMGKYHAVQYYLLATLPEKSLFREEIMLCSQHFLSNALNTFTDPHPLAHCGPQADNDLFIYDIATIKKNVMKCMRRYKMHTIQDAPGLAMVSTFTDSHAQPWTDRQFVLFACSIVFHLPSPTLKDALLLNLGLNERQMGCLQKEYQINNIDCRVSIHSCQLEKKSWRFPFFSAKRHAVSAGDIPTRVLHGNVSEMAAIPEIR